MIDHVRDTIDSFEHLAFCLLPGPAVSARNQSKKPPKGDPGLIDGSARLHRTFSFFHRQALPIEQFRSVTQRSAPRSGIVQILAQRMDLHWATQDGFSSRQILVQPQILQHARSSCLYSGVNAGVPEFSVKGLTDLAEKFSGYIILSESPDAAAYVRRKLWATLKRLPPRILFIPGGQRALCSCWFVCCSHTFWGLLAPSGAS